MIEDDKNCYICRVEYNRDTYILKDGPENSGVYKNCPCRHYFCVPCIEQMFYHDINTCPICRFDWTEWIYTHYNENSEDDSSDESDDE